MILAIAFTNMITQQAQNLKGLILVLAKRTMVQRGRMDFMRKIKFVYTTKMLHALQILIYLW